MKSQSLRAVLAGLVTAVVASLFVATARADVSQTPVVTGCPTGYEHVSVTSLEAAGPYAAPRVIDTAGNNDGYVCAHAQPDSVRDAYCRQGFALACLFEQLGVPHYLFQDDDSRATAAVNAP